MKSKLDFGSIVGITLGLFVIFGIGYFNVPGLHEIEQGTFKYYINRVLLNPVGNFVAASDDGPARLDMFGLEPGILRGFLENVNYFYDIKSLALVFFGVIAATFVNLPISAFADIIKIAQVVFRDESYDYVGTIDRICERATKSRKDGILSLEADLENMANKFFRKGIEIAINEKEVDRLRYLLNNEKEAIENRHIAGAELFNYMASYAPAFGMMGTVMGLVIMMNGFGAGDSAGAEQSTAEKFSGLLAGMAMALVTTFYGVVLANLIFTPMGGKLKRKDEMEMLHKQVIIEGVVSIKQNEHPIIIKEKLMTMVPPEVVLELEDENRAKS